MSIKMSVPKEFFMFGGRPSLRWNPNLATDWICDLEQGI